ncbi:two-component system regulatory protein YycI [Geomicrobium sp. JCM 19038]|uniref:two-component system regulatory protein YycI n=1 Tax=Geomicrobium sp. JCM 19038 TaxID=1460635 RepID=UPI00045F24CA|nr:two-component system regulatory protein YycI [Geomicrobium sp. JCM 19038]GAK06945.1 hypothetical protein JCM19038_659 [Geomicrobium sp. JCM 19038]
MDWSRTKTIFIVTFFLLNAFLTYQLIAKQSFESYASEQGSLEQSFEDIVEAENIIVDTQLPEYRDLPRLNIETEVIPFEEVSSFYNSNDYFQSVDQVAEDQQELILLLSSPYNLDAGSPLSSIREFIDQNIYEGTEYVFGGEVVSSDSDQMEFHYFKNYEGLTLYGSGGDAHLVVTVNDGEITIIEQQFIEIKPHEEDIEVMSPEDAILALREAQVITRNATIHRIELAYHSHITDGEYARYIPAYRIHASNQSFSDEEEMPPYWETPAYIVNADRGNVYALSNES